MKHAYLILPFVLMLLLGSCQSEDFQYTEKVPVLPEQPYNYVDYDFPDHIQHFFDNTPIDNQTTNAGATLGRVLFYDTRLSVNNAVSCGSCHHQVRAFADPNSLSDGFRNGKTSRNSMHIANMSSASLFFWDGNATTLEEQVLMPVRNHVEMGMEDIDILAKKLTLTEYYPELFEDAFGSDEISEQRISYALAQFLRSLQSYDSKWDRGYASDHANFTVSELLGKDLFFGKAGCANCHGGADFNGWSGSAANIGLDIKYDDAGFGARLEEEFWNGVFKVPSLRNVGLTAPYMHDGRFESLAEVIEHYNSGIKSHPNLDYRLTTFMDPLVVDNFFGIPTILPIVEPVTGLEPRKLNLDPGEKQALEDFLLTLSDQTFVTDQKFNNPFQ